MNEDEKVNHFRSELAEQIKYILQLKPLLDAGIVVLTDLSIPESEKDGSVYLHNLYSPDGRLDQILEPSVSKSSTPLFLENLIDSKLRAYHGTIENGRMVPIYEKPIELGKTPIQTTDKICFQFQDDPIYWQFHMSTKSRSSDKENHFELFFDMSDDVQIDVNQFLNWVQDKQIEVARNRVNRLLADMVSSAKIDARFITSSPLSKYFALTQTNAQARTSDLTIKGLLEIPLPYFADASFESIARARENEEAFANFSDALNHAFPEIGKLSDSEVDDLRITENLDDTIRKPTENINQRLKQLERSIFVNSGLLTVGTLIGAAILAAGTLYNEAAAIAAANIPLQLEKIGKYHNKYKEIEKAPSFFYWDATRKSSFKPPPPSATP